MNNPNFFVNSTEKIAALHRIGNKFLTIRTLTLLLERCDGTIENFLALAPAAVGEENTKMLKTLIKDYKNINDKPNEVWEFWNKLGVTIPKEEKPAEGEKEEEKQGVLKKRENLLDKMKDLRNKNI